MVLDLFLRIAGGTIERENLEVIGIFEDFCGGTVASYRGF